MACQGSLLSPAGPPSPPWALCACYAPPPAPQHESQICPGSCLLLTAQLRVTFSTLLRGTAVPGCLGAWWTVLNLSPCWPCSGTPSRKGTLAPVPDVHTGPAQTSGGSFVREPPTRRWGPGNLGGMGDGAKGKGQPPPQSCSEPERTSPPLSAAWMVVGPSWISWGRRAPKGPTLLELLPQVTSLPGPPNLPFSHTGRWASNCCPRAALWPAGVKLL